MRERWLKCKIEPGMFSSEAVIAVSTAYGRTLRFFVPREAVRENRVRVRIVRGGIVTLPTENPSSLPIREEDLVEA